MSVELAIGMVGFIPGIRGAWRIVEIDHSTLHIEHVRTALSRYVNLDDFVVVHLPDRGVR
jgi:hypothetical protein